MRSTGMRAAVLALAGLAGSVLAAPATRAQLGVLGPATASGRGSVTATAAPLLFLARPKVDGTPRTIEGVDDVAALLLRGGYGLSDRLDLRARAVAAEDVFELGAGLQYQLMRVGAVTMAAGGGGHVELFHTDFSPNWFHVVGLDAALVASARLRPSLSLYGALDLAFESADVDLRRDGVSSHLGNFTRAAVVPGIDYALRANLHLVGEVGVRLNDRSYGYAAGGLTFYRH
jgi:hypothetical protein